MDQTHTLNAGFLYRHRRSGLWASMAFEYWSGTPIETEDEGNLPAVLPRRVPGHFTQNVTLGVDVPRHADALRIGLRFNIENLTNNIYKVSQESVFSPGEYCHPRYFSGSMKVNF